MLLKKIWRNGVAFTRGLLFTIMYRINKDGSIGKSFRVFKGATLDIYRKGSCKIGNNVRIDCNSNVVVTEGGKLSIGDNVGIGYFNRVICREKITIGSNTILGPNVMIYDHDHIYSSETGVDRKEYLTSEISIGKNCWIGSNTVILRGTHIGNRCLIAAGCVIKGDIPDGTKVIQKRETFFK